MFRRKQIQDIAVDEGDDVRLHIDSLVSSIKATVPRELLISPNCCIFKIPVTHMRHNKNAFIPNAFSIGPLHHGKRNLKATEKIKARYLQELISRSHSPETILSSMVSSIMEVEKKAQNQVPWMVLKRLFKLTTDARKEPPLIILAMRHMKVTFLSDTIDLRSDSCLKMKGIKHFVDLLRKLSTSSSINHPPDQSINNEGTHRFVHLFRKLSHLSSSTEEKKGRRRVYMGTPSFCYEPRGGWNQIRKDYEQSLPRCEDRFTSYIMFLDNLIITTKDMDILCENQIIYNWLNPEDATQLFNKLYYDTCVNYCYTKLCGDVNRFCKRRWPRWRAMLVRNYFNTPWAVLSTSAAVILLILTLLQTVYGIKK
ncbi:hypothetical protein FH972_011999 [Carpinus fangiana]|uniref:Uncharacterized protein n=1 Tax=Carpinus fangiana TaxID=176857 RepID=A0A5N6R5E7_9ROSI|nr:hypothetical protein FH972_011999 [Carpinus fangiana]